MSDDDGLTGGMFVDEAADREARRLADERAREVLVEVPRFARGTGAQLPPDKSLQLVHRPGLHHSLWGHLLWNAARHLVFLMDTGRIAVAGRSVLELGCGIAGPSLVAALQGARVVCATDYPDDALLRVVAENAAKVLLKEQPPERLAKIDTTKLDARIAEQFAKLCGGGGGDGGGGGGGAEKKAEDGNEKKVSNDDVEVCDRFVASETETKPTQRLNFFVEGLSWGNGDDIQRVCDKSGCVGFDVIFLSDLLFNHICHDQLLATVSRMLSRDGSARAYVTFSFHRPQKKDDDLRFFDKCAFYGLRSELVETNHSYPLMFPDDPGDPAVRKPVYVYELSFRNTNKAAASDAPLDKFRYDVVVQGTGIVETLVSASCARAGLSVLHVDAQSAYGSAFFSAGHKEFAAHLAKWQRLTSAICEYPAIDALEAVVAAQAAEAETEAEAEAEAETQVKAKAGDGDAPAAASSDEAAAPSSGASTAAAAAAAATAAADDLQFALDDARKIRDSRQLSLDTFTTPFLASSALVRAIAQSQMAEHIEFQNVDRMVSIRASSSKTPAVARIPVSRKDIFNMGSASFSMLECRRLMRFLGDISDRSALEKDTDVQRERESAEILAALRRTHAGVDLARTPLSELLKTKYSFSGPLLDLVTVGGTLVTPETPAAAAVPVVFEYLSSIGRYGGSTPYLAPMYSASDLPQIYSRMSAVWGAVFALERSVRGFMRFEGAMPFKYGSASSKRSSGLSDSDKPASTTTTNATKRLQAAVVPTGKSDISLLPDGIRVVLDNGQHISARCLVVPRRERQECSACEEFVRVVLVSKKPLVTWKALEETCGDAPIDDEDKRNRLTAPDPIAVGYAALTVSTTGGAVAVNASLQQWSDLLQMAPKHVVVTHLTARRFAKAADGTECEISTRGFLDAVREQLFFEGDAGDASPAADAERFAEWKKHVVCAFAFHWGENAAFATSAHAAPRKAKNADEEDEEQPVQGEIPVEDAATINGDNEDFRVIEAQTVYSAMNDSLYADETTRVFKEVLKHFGKDENTPIIQKREEATAAAAAAAES